MHNQSPNKMAVVVSSKPEAEDLELLKQGAEAKVYVSSFYGRPCIVKERFVKTYRVAELDKKLSQRRIGQEVRSMARCRKQGIRTPAVYYVDQENRSIYMEFIQDGMLMKDYVNQTLKENDIERLCSLLQLIGRTVSRMHREDVVHGDLTTSNMFYHPSYDNITVIDFGLSFVSALTEDKAVDLYVLERAFVSTHPDAEDLFAELLKAYSEGKGGKSVVSKLDEVRARGRKRTMVG